MDGVHWLRCALEEMATQEIFAELSPEDDSDELPVGIQFLELRGDKCFDLLANTKGGAMELVRWRADRTVVLTPLPLVP